MTALTINFLVLMVSAALGELVHTIDSFSHIASIFDFVMMWTSAIAIVGMLQVIIDEFK